MLLPLLLLASSLICHLPGGPGGVSDAGAAALTSMTGVVQGTPVLSSSGAVSVVPASNNGMPC